MSIFEMTAAAAADIPRTTRDVSTSLNFSVKPGESFAETRENDAKCLCGGDRCSPDVPGVTAGLNVPKTAPLRVTKVDEIVRSG